MHSIIKIDETRIYKSILSMAWPTIIAMLIQTSFNIIDTIFVGRLSARALAAVSLSFPIMFFVMALGNGIGVSITSVVSRALGASKYKAIRKSILTSIWLSFFTGIFSTLSVLFFGKEVLSLMSNDPIVLELAWKYLSVYSYVLFLITISITVNSIFRAKGDMKIPMFIMIVSAILNIVLDPLFIFGVSFIPKMGVSGAALATLLSRLISLIIGVVFLIKKDKDVLLPFKFVIDRKFLKEVVKIGLPSSSTQMVLSVSLLFLNELISYFGSLALAAFTVVFRVESIAYLPALAISNTAITIIGHTVGRNSIKLAKDISLKVAKLNAIIMSSVSLLFIFFSRQIILIFNSNSNVIAIGSLYLKIVPFEYPFIGIYLGLITAFQAVGNAYPSLILNSLRTLIILLPLSYFLSRYTSLGIKGIWFAMIVTSFIVFIGSIIWFILKFEHHARKGYERISNYD